MTLWWCDVATGKLAKVDKSDWGEIQDFRWAPDSRWIAYSMPPATRVRPRLMLYSLGGGARPR